MFSLLYIMKMIFLTNCDMRGNLRMLSLHQSKASQVDSSRGKSMYVVNSLSTSSVGVSVLTDILLGIFSRMAASPFALFGGGATSLFSSGLLYYLSNHMVSGIPSSGDITNAPAILVVSVSPVDLSFLPTTSENLHQWATSLYCSVNTGASLTARSRLSLKQFHFNELNAGSIISGGCNQFACLQIQL